MRNCLVLQRDETDCAAACLSTICMFYGREEAIPRLRDLMGTNTHGTTLLGLSECAQNMGFTAQAIKIDYEQLKTSFTLPCIAHVELPSGLFHFVVIFKINNTNLIIGDPSQGMQKKSFKAFKDIFTGHMLLILPTDAFEKGADKKQSIFERFISFLRPQWKLFVYAIIASSILTILGILSSLFNKILMDEILPFRLYDTLVAVLLIFVLVALTQSIVGFIRQWIMILLSQKIDIPLFLGYFEHVFHLPMKFFSTRKIGDILTRFSDAFTIKAVFSNIAITLIMDVVMAVTVGIILYNMNSLLFAANILMALVSLVLILIFRQPYKKINEQQMQQSATLNSNMIEGLKSLETIKGNSIENEELSRIEKDYIKSLRIGQKEGMLSNTQGTIASFVSTVGGLAIMYLGIIQVMDGTITLGSMMAFSSLSGFFLEPISRLVGLQLQIQEAGISMKRISEIWDYHREDYMENSLQVGEALDGALCFNNVCFKYIGRERILNNISFSVPQGKKVALVGTSGSGKTTVAKLIMKFIEPESGEICFGDTNINEYDYVSIRKNIAYMPQSIELFSRSIYENISLDSNYVQEEIMRAARMANAHEFIMKMPNQYNTVLEESGNGLSIGEKQRIVLARAFYKKCKYLVIDEGTSNLDYRNESNIFDLIYNEMPHATMLIIAHRLSTTRYCDEIVVLDNGQVLEKGTHDQLMHNKQKYYELWSSQNSTRERIGRQHQIPNNKLRNPNMAGEMTYS